MIFWIYWFSSAEYCLVGATRSAYVAKDSLFLAPALISSGILLFDSSRDALLLAILLSTTLKALKISAETLRASRAVRTRYIILIIICRGSLGIDISD